MRNMRMEKAFDYLDSVIGTGRAYSAEELVSIGAVPSCRSIVARSLASSGYIYRLANGVSIKDAGAAFTKRPSQKQIPIEVGLIIAEPSEARHAMPSDIGADLAKFLLLSNNISADAVVVSCDSSVVSGIDAKALSQSGVRLLFDEGGTVEGGDPFFGPSEASLDLSGHVVWRWRIPQKVLDEHARSEGQAVKKRVLNALKVELMDIVTPFSTAGGANTFMVGGDERELSSLIAALKGMSYGAVDLEYVLRDTQRNGYSLFPMIGEDVKWMQDNVVFSDKAQLAAVEPDVPEPDYSEIRDVAAIWSSRLSDYGARIGTGGHVSTEDVEAFGRLMGVDSMVAAYYSDVPIDDILS